MRVGVMIGDRPKEMSVDSIIRDAQNLEKLGINHAWLPQVFSFDAMTAFAAVARETSTIELGTAVVPLQPRSPIVMAQQALSLQDASKGRFTLGIGLSHKMVIEGMFGISYDHPAKVTREYLSVLMPLINKKRVSFKGDYHKINGALEFSHVDSVKVIVAALGPLMLKVAGELSDGTATWMTGPKTLADHIAPKIQKAAKDAGKPTPTIVAGLPICISDDIDGTREMINKFFRMYGMLPSYRAMLDLEGVKNPGDVAIIGNEDSVKAIIKDLFDKGVTDFIAAVSTPDEKSRERTFEFLAAMAKE